MTQITSAEAAKIVADAKHPEHLFKSASVEELKDELRGYQKVLHPDTVDSTLDPTQAATSFNLLQQLYEKAVVKITAGTWGDLDILPRPITILTGNESYTLTHTLRRTDTSLVYSGTNSKTERVILKIAEIQGDNDLLFTERDHLREMRSSPVTKDFSTLLYVPEVVDAFNTPGDSLAVNVFSYEDEEYYTLEDVKKAYPKGVPLQHAAWMIKRVMLALEPAHSLDIIHGAILPQNVVIHPVTRRGILTNWDFSVKAGDKIKAISSIPDQRIWYPHEVLDKTLAYTGTDLYMLANLLLYLCNGSIIRGTFPSDWEKVPGTTAAIGYKHIRGLVSACRLPAQKRLYDIHELYADFKEALGKIFGEPKFHKLKMPESPHKHYGR